MVKIVDKNGVRVVDLGEEWKLDDGQGLASAEYGAMDTA